MAASRAQRIGIWTIAIAMVLGTLVSFVVMIVANDNAKLDQARLEKLMAEYQVEFEEYQGRVEKQSKELSGKYYSDFVKYQSRVGKFSEDVKELGKNDLKVGGGDEIKEDSTFTAYYIGWNPGGKVFDDSIDEESKTLLPPLSVSPGSVIKGWTDGAVGMKVGGVRELTIPAELAYGETGSGENIPPNTPLKFIIMVIPTPETIEAPQPSDELVRLYNRSQGGY